MISRRGILAGIGAVLAAPAIVRLENIMPVRNRLIVPSLPLGWTDHGFVNGEWYVAFVHPEIADILRPLAVRPQLYEVVP